MNPTQLIQTPTTLAPVAGLGRLEALLQPRLSLLWGSDTPTRALLMLATALTVQGQPVRLFDGGNRFDGYFVARLARRWCAHPQGALSRLGLSRAFTCFQLAQLIEDAPASSEPLIVLDLLQTFYDESVPLRESERLLGVTIGHLKRLAAAGPVIVGARQPRQLVKDRWGLLDQLQTAADACLLQPPAEESSLEQLSLFEIG
jgi:hypothetical protein